MFLYGFKQSLIIMFGKQQCHDEWFVFLWKASGRVVPITLLKKRSENYLSSFGEKTAMSKNPGRLENSLRLTMKKINNVHIPCRIVQGNKLEYVILPGKNRKFLFDRFPIWTPIFCSFLGQWMNTNSEKNDLKTKRFRIWWVFEGMMIQIVSMWLICIAHVMSARTRIIFIGPACFCERSDRTWGVWSGVPTAPAKLFSGTQIVFASEASAVDGGGGGPDATNPA